MFFIVCCTPSKPTDKNDIGKSSSEERNYIVDVGDTISIDFEFNLSIGIAKCWLNKKDCEAVSLLKNFNLEKVNPTCEGCKGKTKFAFVAKERGKCVIKIGNVSIRSGDKDCEDDEFNDVQEYETYLIEVR